MKRLRIIALVLLSLALVTLACGLGLGKTQPAPGGEEPAAQPAEAQPPPAESPEEEAGSLETKPAVEAGPEAPGESAEGEVEEAPLDFSTSMSGLENLNSYRAAFRFDWNGTKGGQPVTGYMEMRSAFVREPPAQELHFEGEGFSEGEDQGLGKVSFVQVGDTAWLYESESDNWVQVPAGSLDFAEGLFFQPEDLLGQFDVTKGRRSLLPQEINGVQAYKYTFNEKDFDLGALSEGEEVPRADGEVYVAVDGGYVVRLAIDVDLRYADPNEIFEEGNVKMTFDISDVNQPITVEPPAEAEAQSGGRDDIPMLPDAQVQFSSTEFISYQTANSLEDAAQFYETEMPKNGWTTEEGNTIMGDAAILNYTKGDETVNLIISDDGGETSVTITISQE